MKMLQSSPASLASALNAQGELAGHFVFGVEGSIALHELLAGSALNGRAHELFGRSVLIATESQLAAAAALLELDGVARRIILCPPDLPLEHLPYVVETAGADAIVSDRAETGLEAPGVKLFIHSDGKIMPGNWDATRQYETEWILLTSGTTGVPKLVVHTLATLAGGFAAGEADPSSCGVEYVLRHPPIWRPANFSTRYSDRHVDGIVERPGINGGLPCTRRGPRSDPYFGNAVTLASRSNESLGPPAFAGIYSIVRRNHGPGDSGSS